MFTVHNKQANSSRQRVLSWWWRTFLSKTQLSSYTEELETYFTLAEILTETVGNCGFKTVFFVKLKPSEAS